MTRRILGEQSLLKLGSVALALLVFAGCATTGTKSSRRGQREGTLSAERLRKVRSHQAKLEEIRERRLILGDVRKSQTVRVKSRNVQNVRPEQESQWSVPPGVEREQLKHLARESIDEADSFLTAQSSSPVIGSEELAAFDHLKANEKIPRKLPGKLPVQPAPVEASTGQGPIVDLTAIRSSAAKPASGKSQRGGQSNEGQANDKTGWVASRIAAPKEVDAKPVESEQAEHILYAGVMRAFKRRDQAGLSQSVNLFMKTYPDSVYADNALYLEAMLALEKAAYPQAERAIAALLRNYPNGNKVVSALFVRAAIYRDKKQWKKARSILEDIKKNYPGSPESQRVPLEVRMLASLEKKGHHR